jgi:pimeloyl-ACP methyl ester carboxylesterase
VTDRGPTVLALHGQPGTGDDFAAVARALDGRCRVLAPDRPGWGSRVEERAGGFAAGADDAVALLDREGVDQAVVLGFSWGGGVALELARRHPDRVGALVLAASIGPGEPTPADRMLALPLAGRVICAGGLAATRLALRRPAFHGLVSGGMSGLTSDHVRTFADRCLSPAVLDSFMVEQRALVREFPAVLRDIGAVRVPTVVVRGERDRMIATSSARQLAEGISGAELQIVPGAGHFLPGAGASVLADAVLAVAGRAGW